MKYFLTFAFVFILIIIELKAQSDTLSIKMKDGSIDKIACSQIKNVKLFTLFNDKLICRNCLRSANFMSSYNHTVQQIDISGIPSGLYFIKLGDKVSKFVKL